VTIGIHKGVFSDNSVMIVLLRVITFLICGSNDRETSVWPWRIVFFSNLIGSILTMHFAMDENLYDLYYLHLSNTMLQIVWWIFFWLCLFKSPSHVRDDTTHYTSENSRNGNLKKFDKRNDIMGCLVSNDEVDEDSELLRSLKAPPQYDAVLDAIGNSCMDEGHEPSLCHTCHCCRTLRSKHCKIQRKCVEKFDHFWSVNLRNIDYAYVF
jgi:hypothetical protein